MADQASEFMRQSQAMAQQSWEQWMRFLQQSAPATPQFGTQLGGSFGSPFGGGVPGAGFGMPGAGFGMPTGAPMNDVLERSLNGIKGYMDWMQRAAGSQVDPAGTDWQAQMQQLFGQASQPFGQAFNGIDSTAAQGFVQQWQAWLAASGQGGLGDWQKSLQMPAFGLHREQQEQQQVLIAAMLDSAEQQRRYQALLMRANGQGLERLQNKLAEHSEPGRQIESLKGLYDLWIDSAEEAYAEIALSDEFREVYGAMVNAQMRERQLQQKQLEDYCRQLGLPTRSEVDSLGRRLQEVRRELRASGAAAPTGEVEMLRAEVSALKKRLAGMGTGASERAVPETASTEASARAGVVSKRSRPAPAKAKAKTKAKAKARKPAARKKVAAVSETVSAKKAAPAKPVAAPKKAASAAKPSKPSSKGKKMDARKRPAKGGKGASPRKAAASSAAVVNPGFPAPRRAGRK